MIPFRVLFWNMGKTATPVHVAQLAKQYEPDVIVLAESNHGLATMVETLNTHTGLLYKVPMSVESRIRVFVKLHSRQVHPIWDGHYLTIKHIQPTVGESLLLAAAHLPSKLRAAKRIRTVLHEERLFFYNPMWSLMGDHSNIPGTFYYPSSESVAYFWNMFDQVLLRPDLAQHFKPGDVIIADSVGGESLLNRNGLPNKKISDHLPIIATLRLEGLNNGI